MLVKIDGKNYSFFDEIKVSKKLDSIASLFSFKGRFNPDNPEHKSIFKPLSYLDVEIYSNDNKLQLKGMTVSSQLGSDSERKLQSISGYSSCGILSDCTIPYSSYPLEKNNVNLRDIVTDLLKPFGVGFLIDSSAENLMNLNYQKTVAEPSQSVASFIVKLAAQRNIIVSHTNDGRLFFYKPDINSKPKFFFNQENTTSMSLSVNGQSIHSNINVIRQPSKENPGLTPVDESINDLVDINRTIVKTMSNGSETDTKNAADNLLASELKSISISVSLNKIIEGIQCGDIIEVENKEIHIYNRSKLIVSEIDINESSNNESMSLKLLLPETFTGSNPKNIFE